MKNLIYALIAFGLSLLLWCTVSPAQAANCSTYPFTLTNGQTADATQVMANFNSILSCGNSNLAHNGANSDITSLSGLLTPISIPQGGTGSTTGALSGDVGGTLSATAIQAGAVVNADLAAMADQTIKGNVSGGSASPVDMTAAQVETMIQTKLPFEFYTFIGGTTGNAWNLAAYQPSTNVILATGNSRCTVGTGATGTTTYTLKDNGTSIGTAVITASSTTCTATITSSPYTMTAGHTLTLVGPATGDATAADVGITFGGTRG